MSEFENPKESIARQEEKRKEWEQYASDAAEIKDNLGKGIDSGIFDTVVALKALDISTTASCEGHLEHGLAFPWIDVEAPAPEGWREDEEKKEEWKEANLAQRAKIENILTDYYSNRNVATGVKLKIVDRGIFGAFRIQSEGALDEDKEIRPEFKKEMADFTQFLKSKFFNK
jgi:hypothetical protein